MKKVLYFIVATLAVASCNSLNDRDAMSWGEVVSASSGGTTGTASSYIALSSGIGDIDYAITGDDGSAYLYTFQDNAQSIPEQLTVYDTGSTTPDLVMAFDDYGVPSSVAADGYTIVFDNIQDDSFDAAVVYENGTIELYEDLPISFDWSSYDSAISGASLSNALYADATTRAGSPSKVQLKWINDAVKVVTTAISINVTIDIQISLTIICVGGPIEDIIDAAEDVATSDSTTLDDPIFVNYPFFRNVYPNYVSTTTIVNVFISIVIEITVIIDNSQSDIEIAQSALDTGIGDVKVTLSWNDYSDIDLHVIDPSGYRICYYQTISPTTGGWLDRDDTVGGASATENIYFESSCNGVYYVYVHYYDTYNGVYSVDYQVAIFVNGRTINTVVPTPFSYTDSDSDWDFIMQFEIRDGELVSSSTVEPATLPEYDSSYDSGNGDDSIPPTDSGSNVDDAVEEDFEDMFPSATELTWTVTEEYYVATCVVDGKGVTALYYIEGGWYKTEYETQINELPESITESLDYKEYYNIFYEWIIDIVRVVQYGVEEDIYIITAQESLQVGARKITLQFNSNGELLEEEETTVTDEDVVEPLATPLYAGRLMNLPAKR